MINFLSIKQVAAECPAGRGLRPLANLPNHDPSGAMVLRIQGNASFRPGGFTLVELLMTIAVIALLAVMMVPALSAAFRTRENAKCAVKLRVAVDAFELYAADHGSYPADTTPGVVPPEMKTYYFPCYKIDEWWQQPTELGGQFDWDFGYHFAVSVSISRPAVSSKQLTEFDALVDDGNLSTGTFRKVGDQYHFILEE